MLFQNWLKTLAVDFARRSSGRDRRKARSASGNIVSTQQDFVCTAMVETLETRKLLSVDPVLVADIVVGFGGSNPSNFVNVNGTLFFTADDHVNGSELWKSDGTSAGTTLVKDIFRGAGPSNLLSLTNVNGTLFFSANDFVNGQELWQSDGTSAGTTLVKNIVSGSYGSTPFSLTNVNGTLFFRATDGVNGFELWKSDGTSAGTTLVKDISSGSSHSFPFSLTNVNGTLFFRANDGTNGYELWQSDSTSAGTTLVKDIRSGISGSYPNFLTNVNGTLFFRATDGVHGNELWQSDGTSIGTRLVKDSRSGSGGSYPDYLTNVNGTLFFRATDGVHGDELWQSDGTSAGTTLVKDIVSGSGNSSPIHLTNVNGTLFFRADDGTNGNELWQSDGTSAGTTLFKHIRSGSSGSYLSYLTNVNGTLFFDHNDEVNGSELWKVDVPADTPKVHVQAFSFLPPAIVKDIRSGSSSSFPGSLTNVNGTLFFSANDGVNGRELWQSDGTSAGTTLVKDIVTGSNGSYPSYLTNMNGTLFFSANDGTNGSELWQSDGTSAGTTLVKDINGNSGSSPRYLTNVNGTLFFSANDGGNDRELWQSDGTSAGTTLVKDIVSGSSGSYPRYLTNVNGTLFFSAIDGTNGFELWQSVGTSAGTNLVKDIFSGSDGSYPRSLTNVNGTLFFSANVGTNGYELWQSDGTSAGTTFVKDIRSGSTSSYPSYLTNMNGTLFFRANDGVNGRELWQSDGTSAGTTLVKDIRSGSSSSYPNSLTNVNGTLFFRATDGVNGDELWQSNGTSAGTTLVNHIRNGSDSSYPQILTNVNGTLFFTADDSVNGSELWSMPVNSRPQLMAFSTVVDTTNQDTEVELTFAEFLAQGDEFDVAGTVDAFVVKAVSNGTLKIGPSAGTATAFAVGSNDKINATLNAYWAPDEDSHGKPIVAVTVLALDNTGLTSILPVTAAVKVSSVADTPTVTNAATQVNMQTTAGLVISRNAADGAEVTHFKISNIIGGTLFQNDGTTPISNNQFITFAQANAGLKYTPALNSAAIGQFIVQASKRNVDSGIGGNSVTASISVAPSKPSVTVPASNSSQRPAISWSPEIGATRYEVWISNLSTVSSTPHFATTAGTSYVPTVDLGIGRFLVWVRAKADSGVVSEWSQGRGFTILIPVTANQPTLQQTTFRPTLTWNAVFGADHYDVWIDNISNGVRQFVRNTNVSSTTFTVPADLPVGNYRAWVRGIAQDNFGGAWSSQVTFRIAVAPTITQGQNAGFANTPVIRWNPLPGADHYDVWIDNLRTVATQVVRNKNVTSATYTGPDTLPFGSYRIWVQGIATDGYPTGWSSANFSIIGPPTLVQGPSSTFDNTPMFAWNILPRATKYEVSIQSLTTGITILNPKNITGTQFIPTASLNDGPYRWWVRAETAQGLKSLWSAPMDITIGGRTKLLTPPGTTSDTTPTFTWQSVDGVASYDLWVDKIGGRSQIIRRQLLSATATTYTPPTALSAGMYRAWIRAISTTGQNSLWSVPVDFTVATNRERLDSPNLLPDTLASAAVQLTAFGPQPTASVSQDDRRNPSVESPPDAVIAVETNTPAVSSGGLLYPPSKIRIDDAELDAVMADRALMHVL